MIFKIILQIHPGIKELKNMYKAINLFGVKS